MWSVGCIFAEMLGGKPLFKGRDYVDQLNQILGILGTPDEETLRRVGSERAQIYIRSLQKMPKKTFSQLYPKANPLALDLLEKLLKFDPATRITVEQALAHPYLAAYHDEEDEVGISMALSAPDRDAINQSQQQNNRNSMHEYGAASQHAIVPSEDMEVDELEKELGGMA
ncbi:14849_t:CDS:2 [Acaulospora colombiana]|uniref:14849_t:CDS:1 n=1 Tax=Acaulospora colombiana TaxID=27376 RepID=A0ACA9N1H6_9GLOM|nr:14849_t:CDS:2 [Acaulospora colombiana]